MLAWAPSRAGEQHTDGARMRPDLRPMLATLTTEPPPGSGWLYEIKWDGVRAIACPTPVVWIIGRTKTDGPPDYAAVHKIQAEQAPDMACRWNCKAGKCGSCSAEINGQPRLMCMSRLNSINLNEPNINTNGFLGDRVLVNLQYDPYMQVRARRYRFRILNAANDRFFNFQWYVADPSTGAPL